MEMSADILKAIAGARIRETQMLIVELSGVFWVAAELLILLFIMEARRHLARNPLPPRPVWDRTSSRRAGLFSLLTAAALGTVLVRSLLWPPLSVYLQREPLNINDAAIYDFLAVLRHLKVWAAFVTAWVLLETAIVYQGFQAYRTLCNRLGSGRKVFSPAQPFPKSLLALLVTAGVVAVLSFSMPVFVAAPTVEPVSKAADLWSQVLSSSENRLHPYRNAMYLYLRMAGVVWVSVEWVAALVLWRAWHLLRRAERARDSQS